MSSGRINLAVTRAILTVAKVPIFVKMFKILLAFALAGPASAVLSTAPAPSIYSRLQGVKVTRASDGVPVTLTSNWRKDVAFGIGGERAIVAYLRHFG